MKKVIIIIIVAIIAISMKSDLRPYNIFNSKGKVQQFDKIIDKIADADIIMFGELHNNSISHWLELEVAKAVYEKRGSDFIMGAEMYEADQQLIINEYLSGAVKYKYFKDQARLWKNDATDYYPILKFAKEKHIPMIATNVPRRYAAIVNKGSLLALDSLSDEAKKYIAPLPIHYFKDAECYTGMIAAMGGHKSARMTNIVKAQALKDATMAHFILENWKEGKCFYHFNGAYHSNNKESIILYLKKANPDLNIVSISTVTQENIDSISDESKNLADFIIVVDEDVTNTY